MGCTIIYAISMGVFWTFLLRRMPQEKIWTVIVILISPFLVLVNPNFPYTLVQLSILYSLLFVLIDRRDIALAISVIGYLSVPSLPLVLTLLLVAMIGVDWLL